MGVGVLSTLSVDPRKKKLRRTADDFRAKLIAEVRHSREIAAEDGRERCSGVQTRGSACSSARLGVDSVSSYSSHKSFKDGSLADDTGRDGSISMPLRVSSLGAGILSTCRSSRHLVNGDMVVTVPGRVGCEDDKVVVAGDLHRLLRTRRVHKHKRDAKKGYIRRRLTNLEEGAQSQVSGVDTEALGMISQVMSEPSSQMANFTLLEDERRLVFKVLQKHFLFSDLSRAEHDMLVEQTFRIEKTDGTILCTAGEKGDSCYIIISGVCSVLNGNKQVAQLSAGHTFGELAMLYDVPRTATIMCSSERVVLVMMQGTSIRRCLARFKERTLNQTLGFLNEHDHFSKLMLDEKRMFANLLSPQTFEPGALLIQECSSGTAELMYLIQEGTIEVTDQYKNRKVLGAGAVLSGQKTPYGVQAVAAQATSAVKCWAIGQRVINRLFGNIGEVLRRSTVRSFLDSASVFKELTEKQRITVAGLFQDQPFKKGEVIVTTLADPQLVLVMEGEVSVVPPSWNAKAKPKRLPGGDLDGFSRMGSEPELELPHCASDEARAEEHGEISLLQRGAVFGEKTFRGGCSMEQCLIAKTDAVVCRAGYDEVCRALRGCAEKTQPLTYVVQRNRMKEHLAKVFPFSALYEELADAVIEAFETEEYAFDEVIVQRSDTPRCSSRFCIIVEGEALRKSPDGSAPVPMERWASFGARQMLLGAPVEADITAAASGCTMKSINSATFQQVCGTLFSELYAKMYHWDLQIKLGDVMLEGILGRGQFGVVNRASILVLPGQEFALKKISKRQVLEQDQQAVIRLEREILEECCHPLIVRLINTFQDERNVYILMENITGGDLFTAIRHIGRLNEEQVLFFSASIVLAIEYLHSRGIMYRDLKPENVMLQGDGRMKIIDMGCCSRKDRSYTLVGTPEYIAPEVVLGTGYSKAVDWWSLGVIMYEMACGPLPFGEGCSDVLEVFKEILEKPLVIQAKVSSEAQDLIQSFLERAPEQRLGTHSICGGKNDEIREHMYFENLQWDAILRHTISPPYKPPMPGMMMAEGSEVVLSHSEAKPHPSHFEVASVEAGVAHSLTAPTRGTAAEMDEESLKPDSEADLSCFGGF